MKIGFSKVSSQCKSLHFIFYTFSSFSSFFSSSGSSSAGPSLPGPPLETPIYAGIGGSGALGFSGIGSVIQGETHFLLS